MNPLANLKDIHAAPAPGWWPPALGWWGVMIIALLLLAIALFLLIRRYRQRRRQQAVIRLFRSVLSDYKESADAVWLAGQLSQLIRRLMLAKGEHQQLGLSGEAFLAYLDQGCTGQPFTAGPGRALLDVPYRPQADLDGQALYDTVMQWVSQQVHRL